MKLLLLILLLITFNVTAQTYVKVADKPEYAKYEQWCKVKINKTVYQYGKYKVMKINGQYSDSLGNYVAVNPVKIVWSEGVVSPEGRNSITVDPNEMCIRVVTTIQVWRRYPSIADFYANWVTNKIAK